MLPLSEIPSQLKPEQNKVSTDIGSPRGRLVPVFLQPVILRGNQPLHERKLFRLFRFPHDEYNSKRYRIQQNKSNKLKGLNSIFSQPFDDIFFSININLFLLSDGIIVLLFLFIIFIFLLRFQYCTVVLTIQI